MELLALLVFVVLPVFVVPQLWDHSLGGAAQHFGGGQSLRGGHLPIGGDPSGASSAATVADRRGYQTEEFRYEKVRTIVKHHPQVVTKHLPYEIIKHVPVYKPIFKTVVKHVPKPYSVVKHVPLYKTVEMFEHMPVYDPEITNYVPTENHYYHQNQMTKPLYVDKSRPIGPSYDPVGKFLQHLY